MAVVLSTMIPLGSKIINFELLDVISNNNYKLTENKSQIATVIMFICVHCPFVKLINSKLGEISQIYSQKGVKFIAINSNDIERYTDDSEENMVLQAKEFNFAFPYLMDYTQELAKSYDAQCTPDFFVYDYNDKLVYRGQFDSARPNNGKLVTGIDLSSVLDSLINSTKISENQIPSAGCNIKWKV